MKVAILLLVVALGCASAEQESYKGHRLVRLKPRHDGHIDLIEAWEKNTDFDIWNSIRGLQQPIDVSLSPRAFGFYKVLFDKHQIDYEIVNENIQDLIDYQRATMRGVKETGKIVGKYARYAEIQAWINQVVADNPTLASTNVIGQSVQNRDQRILILRTAPRTKKLWIDAGIHAREWLSPCTCVFIVDRIISEYKNNNVDIVRLLQNYEIHILPLVNPDGYEWSHTNARLWRKNRRVNTGSACLGVDLNRNCDQAWMHSGASQLACSDIYAGPTPDSEPETRGYQQWILQNQGQWHAFFTIHTYGQWWLTPWGHNSSLPEDYDDLFRMGTLGANELASHYGTRFTVGSSSRLLYDASGSSCDWARGKAGVKYTYTLELRPGSGTPDAAFGFMIPEDRCQPSGIETYHAIRRVFVEIMDEFETKNKK